MMSPVWSDIEALIRVADPSKAVDLLLGTPISPAPPSMADNHTENPQPLALQAQGPIFAQWASDAASLRAWWANLQLNASCALQEKMTFFWGSHFTTQFALGEQSYVVAPLLYRQNMLFRSSYIDNFKDLVKAVTLDGAMLVYLGGDQNKVVAPNENYARELMELFTCGLGGGYAEIDVHAAARILTGWQVYQYTGDPFPNGIFASYFTAKLHDTQAKTYLSMPFAAIDASTNTEFLVKQNEVYGLIDTLFAQLGPAIAKYICTKLYRFFVYSDPASVDQSVVSAMADIFMNGVSPGNPWDIKPVISTLLKSAHFFDNANIGAQIKTPAEYIIGMARQIVPTYPIDANMTAAGQQFFQPPNVSGWPGYHDWITTNTYPVRGTEADAVLNPSLFDDSTALAFIQQFPNHTDATALSVGIGQLLLPRPLSAGRKSTFASKLTAGGPVYEWSTILSSSPSTAARNLRDLLSYIVSLPDFELC
jgi:uncharacterized protein (DUF1800 family)